MAPEIFFSEYIKHISAYFLCCKINDKEPDEEIMARLEKPLNLHEVMIDDFRRTLLAKVAANLALGKSYNPMTDKQIGPVIQQICCGN